MVLVGAACSIGYFAGGKKTPALALAGGVCYTVQFLEGLCSRSFIYLNNIVEPSEAIDKLNSMIDTKPEMRINISNFHYEDVEIKKQENPALKSEA
jgi:hypothetical protein